MYPQSSQRRDEDRAGQKPLSEVCVQLRGVPPKPNAHSVQGGGVDRSGSPGFEVMSPITLQRNGDLSDEQNQINHQ